MQYIKDLIIDNNKKCIVSGTGISANLLKTININDYFIIGVNDINKLNIHIDILLLVDKKEIFLTDKKFTKEYNISRVLDIEKTNCKYVVLADNSWNFYDDKKYLFTLKDNINKKKHIDIYEDALDYGYDSPTVACLLAITLGFKNIGIIGVDFTDNHFFIVDGTHTLVKNNYLQQINSCYNIINEYCKNNDIKLYNLSQGSKIDTIDKINLINF